MRDFVQANWNSPTIDVSRIKFGNSWWDGFGPFQIHFRDYDVPRVPISLTQDMAYISTAVTCHVFCRKLNRMAQPVEFDDLKVELHRIIEANRRGMSTVSAINSNFMKVTDSRDIIEDVDYYSTIWHSVTTVEVRYWIATTAP